VKKHERARQHREKAMNVGHRELGPARQPNSSGYEHAE